MLPVAVVVSTGDELRERAGNGKTDVVIQNVAHVGGILGALVPRSKIKDRQRVKLRTDLSDLQRRARGLTVRASAAGMAP